jgi:hypothetical protein
MTSSDLAITDTDAVRESVWEAEVSDRRAAILGDAVARTIQFRRSLATFPL